MSLVIKLLAFGLKQVIGETTEFVVDSVQKHFTDHSQSLPKALARANDRTWQTLGIALSGDGLLDQIKVFFASSDDKGVREQIRLFLKSNTIRFEGSSVDFRKKCLAELTTARQVGMLSARTLSSEEIALQAGNFKRYADLKGLVDGAEEVMTQIADGLAAEFPNLDKLLRHCPGEGPPLVLSAFAFFFRREVETNQQLANGLFLDGLRQLSDSQAKAFEGVSEALSALDNQFGQVFEQLGHVQTVVTKSHPMIVSIGAAVDEIKEELHNLPDEFRRMIQEVLSHIPPDQAKKIASDLKVRWEKAHPAKPLPKSGELITNNIGMTFAWIPPGRFTMGSPKKEKDRTGNEAQHKVVLSNGIYLGVHPVTQEQWQEVMGNNPSHFKGEKNLPVECVSWEDCQEFIRKLRKRDKNPYRLPTEAEWEHACRTERTMAFYFGNTISTEKANYDGNHKYGNGKKGVYREKTTPVGSLQVNMWGLYDMHGNVWEWCNDWYGEYSQESVTDPEGPPTGTSRVLRGGSWRSFPQRCRSASRYHAEPDTCECDIGFRLCFGVI